MNIALIGYGKMGRTIETLGLKQGYTFPLVVDVDNSVDLNKEKLQGVDAAMEFTTPGSAPSNILTCIELGIPVVSGTTGWNARFSEIEAACREKNGAFFYASNFSIGVNILFAMNRQLARIMERFPDYQVSIEEVHHIHKLDAPSGTAITLAGQIIEEQERIKGWDLEKQDDPSQMHIHAIREGEVKGKHTIRYESVLDSISLGHDAKSRDAFAAGALLAASFMKGRSGIFGMSDLLNI
ncbi:MAG: 4-hydroxy-tetrahydrodipicolinate reductase [Bacteroidales bacterium]|nr:4-hydroxy-tetrahydrodipicolinate reductase [Bacteroidales bacterium]